MPAVSSVVVSGGTLDLGKNTFAQTGGNIFFAGGVVQDGSLVYAGTYSGTAGTVSANLSGAAGLSKTGTGLLVLSGQNSYTGDTQVNGGTLVVNGSLYSSGGEVDVNGGVLSGTGSVGAVHVYSTGVLVPGSAAGVGTLGVANLALDSGSVLNYTLATASNSAFLNVSGNVNLPSSAVTLNLFDGGSLGPGTYALIGYGSLVGTPSSAFAIGNMPTSVANDTFSFTTKDNVIDLVISGTFSVSAGTWATNGGGVWSGTGNWTASVPGTGQDTAVFGTVLTSGRATVILDSSHASPALVSVPSEETLTSSVPATGVC